MQYPRNFGSDACDAFSEKSKYQSSQCERGETERIGWMKKRGKQDNLSTKDKELEALNYQVINTCVRIIVYLITAYVIHKINLKFFSHLISVMIPNSF